MDLKVYSAPSNIALIKYMGKTNAMDNLPTNTSLSYTLEHLRTFITLEKNDKDEWRVLQGDGLFPLVLSEKGKQKFINHLSFLREQAQVKEFFLIKSANNFPSDCGIASSSSSFAALTMAAMNEFQKLSNNLLDLSPSNLSALSRRGSGSSCRSFFSPWCAWKTDRGFSLDFPYTHLHHIVILVDIRKKEVSSSEAHLRVTTSPFFQERLTNVEKRFHDLSLALKNSNWLILRKLCFDEFTEMHQLFESSMPPFSYRNEATFKVIDQLLLLEKKNQEKAPIITMDAGSNIHLLFKNEDLDLAKKYRSLFNGYDLLTSFQKELK
ncbi:MAG: diphosphomevalonate decarboxylase [Deltaproteobacteria bacterium]|nr:diphosphomevalonate decarboxylase [Deltaproteobacteria bacterium]